jgi:prefoldin subunit 5
MNEIQFLNAMIKDLENHIKTIQQRIRKLEKEVSK